MSTRVGALAPFCGEFPGGLFLPSAQPFFGAHVRGPNAITCPSRFPCVSVRANGSNGSRLRLKNEWPHHVMLFRFKDVAVPYIFVTSVRLLSGTVKDVVGSSNFIMTVVHSPGSIRTVSFQPASLRSGRRSGPVKVGVPS